MDSAITFSPKKDSLANFTARHSSLASLCKLWYLLSTISGGFYSHVIVKTIPGIMTDGVGVVGWSTGALGEIIPGIVTDGVGVVAGSTCVVCEIIPGIVIHVDEVRTCRWKKARI